jgi:hypothetical protein
LRYLGLNASSVVTLNGLPAVPVYDSGDGRFPQTIAHAIGDLLRAVANATTRQPRNFHGLRYSLSVSICRFRERIRTQCLITSRAHQFGQRSDLYLRRLDSLTRLIQRAAPPRQSA